jgi:hypothetical protein
MASLLKIADTNRANCTQAAAIEAPSPRAEARNEQHKLAGSVREVGKGQKTP